MPKPQYTQHFRDSWLQDPHLKDWLQVIESTAGQVAKCKFCGTTLRSHYGDLKSHGMSKKHLQNKKVIIMQPKIPFKPEPTGSRKKEEARLALFTAMHTSIRVVDHLGEFNKSAEHIARVDDQWHQIHLLKWNETNNTKKFWNEVLHFKDAQGNSRFDELATFAITLLILPHSNADVERLFSSMNVIKNKQRNRMTLKLLTAILRVRCGLRLEGKCCNNYEVPVSVVKQIGTKESYQSDTDDDGADKTDSSEDELI
ncbi:hypothetical protein EVAR_77931_1 [Eumeta japonica]|uniref:HAT C-terminal dimerisation domain-containing protein n=1 Tax=Eumeta variegata TaxID=151549 RepID=A0A4C1XUQ9_EUMVA|nr:hypothetical protein EVAR_77931_1 [Eumeta japonica]